MSTDEQRDRVCAPYARRLFRGRTVSRLRSFTEPLVAPLATDGVPVRAPGRAVTYAGAAGLIFPGRRGSGEVRCESGAVPQL
jgi:hypothetical protein